MRAWVVLCRDYLDYLDYLDYPTSPMLSLLAVITHLVTMYEYHTLSHSHRAGRAEREGQVNKHSKLREFLHHSSADQGPGRTYSVIGVWQRIADTSEKGIAASGSNQQSAEQRDTRPSSACGGRM